MTKGGVFHPDFKAMPWWWEAWQPQAEPPIDLSAGPTWRSSVAAMPG